METMFLVNTKNFNCYEYSTVHGEYVDYSGALYNDGGQNLTITQYLETIVVNDVDDYEVLTWDQFEPIYTKQQRDTYLKGPSRITEEEYFEALECLPPENWQYGQSIEHFRMCEYLTGTITAQYAKRGEEYISKAIDVSDKSTWITVADFEAVRGAL